MTNKANNKAIGTVAAPEKHCKKAQASRCPRITKKARLISFLSAKSGADAAAISKRLGWLPHTTRAALTGLRKAGYEIISVKPGHGKATRYRIVAMPEADVA